MTNEEFQGRPPTANAAQKVDSASDDRTANNAVRHTYRVLDQSEKDAMVAIKDAGADVVH